MGLGDDGEGEGKHQGSSGSALVVGLGDMCGWVQHLGDRGDGEQASWALMALVRTY